MRAATKRLATAGCDSPRLDAELLLAEALGGERADLYRACRGAAVDPGAAERFDALVRRREAREPVAYILGRREFRRLELAVDARVLVPRPETEHLVEAAVELLPYGASVVDVGTGSGAVALALKDERPDLRVTGTDISLDAIEVAAGNGRRLDLDVLFRTGDLLGAIPPYDLDAVVGNLPYVADGSVLSPEIGREPAHALFAGLDGLDAIRRLAGDLSRLTTVKLTALEIAADQGRAVSGLLAAAGFAQVAVRPDLTGRDRVVVGWR